MPAKRHSPDRRRGAVQEGGLWDAAWSAPESPARPEGPAPFPVSERRIYRAGGNGAEEPGGRPGRTRAREGGARGPSVKQRRSPVLALLVIVAIAVVIALAGLAARGGGLNGSEDNVGTFKFLPITTTTTT